MRETIGFSRMESQFPPNLKSLPRSKETIGFSRMESQFQPNHHPFTTSCRLHPTKVEGSLKLKSRQHLRLKLRLHAAEADGLLPLVSHVCYYLPKKRNSEQRPKNKEPEWLHASCLGGYCVPMHL